MPERADATGSGSSPLCLDQDTLNAYAQKKLDPERCSEAEAHLAHCADCFAAASDAARRMGATAEASTERDPALGALEGAAPVRLASGAIVGRYRVVGLVGEGGMGSVYEAYDPQLDRAVALKLVRADKLAEPTARARLAREARTMAKLSHPGVVTVFDAGEFGRDFFIAMELVVGVTLATWLGESGRSYDQVMDRFLAAGRGLAAAHAAGIVHRDFKPENILVDKEGRVAVTDFGLAVPPSLYAGVDVDAQASPPSAGIGVTRTGTVLGTPRYMSPEQHAGARLDARSDQFSFAIALYRALFKEWPFDGATVAEARLAMAEGRVREPPAASTVPAHVRAALRRALAFKPEDRFPSLVALLASLEPPAPPAPPPGTSGSRRMVVRVAVVALSAVGLGIALVWSRAHEPTLVAPVPAVALSRRPGGRTPVLIAGLANQSGDSRLDETIDAVLGESLYASKLIDRFPPYQIRTLAAELGVDAAAGVEKVSQALLARDGGKVLTLRATLVRTDSGLRLTVAARDVASGQTAFEASRDATSPAEIVLAAAALAREVRRTLGDAALPDAATDTLGLSPSLEALHAWAEGQRLVATGEPFVAVEKLRHAVALDPHFTLAHADLGLALYNTLASAESAVESEVALEQADHLGERRRLKLLADYYGATGRFAESIASYEQLLNLWPGDLSSEISVTATALDAREWPLTVELSRRAARDHPESVVAHQNLVVAELARGSFEDAARDGEAAIARFAHPPRYTFAHLAMAETLEGQRALALVVLDKLAVIDPEFADEARADLAFYEGRLDDAIKLLEGQIREGNARGAPSYFLRTEYITLALIHLRRGDRSWALAALTPLVADIKKDANDRVTYTLAHALVESGGESLAATVTKGWAESSAIEERMYASLLRGDSLRAHGKGHEAILAYREAGRSVDAWLVHARLGESYLSEHLWADAHRELSLCIARRGEGAMDVTPGLHVLPRVYYGLALAKEGLGDANLAAAWEAFLAIEPAAQGDPLATDAAKRLALLKK